MSIRTVLAWLAAILIITVGIALCSTDTLMTPIERSYRERGFQ
jgi:hypothetical protein